MRGKDVFRELWWSERGSRSACVAVKVNRGAGSAVAASMVAGRVAIT
jgi:hypothetical protein